LAAKLNSLDPTMQIQQIQFTSDPEVNGFWTPELGYTFVVDCPEILTTLALMYTQRTTPTSPARPVSNRNGQSVSPSTIIQADPNDPAVAVAPLFDPNQFLSDMTRQALYDALLDNSSVLPIKDDEHLTVVAAPQPFGNPLLPSSRKLILTIKGSDLLALRSGKLNRADAKLRIVERRF
jgi:hypothetical protein